MSYESNCLQNNNFDLVPLTGAKVKNRNKLSDIKRENAYNSIINRLLWSRFDYKGIPDNLSITSEQIERATCCGVSVLYKVPVECASKGEIVCTPLEWVGVKKVDNTAEHFITHFADFSVTDEQLDKYVIIKNNFEMSNDYDFLEWTAQMLNDTDISEHQLIKWSRMTPIAKVVDDKSIAVVENVLKRVYNGEPWVCYSDYSKMINGGTTTSRDDSVLRLNDETAIEKMHFLSEYHYELIRRLCNLYNIPFHTTAKSAQNLESEVHNTDIFSRMQTENGLKWRRKSEKALSEFFGTEIKIELSELFKKENEVIEKNINNIDTKNVINPEINKKPESEGQDE